MSHLPLEARARRMVMIGSALTLTSALGAVIFWLLNAHWVLLSVWIIAVPVNLYLTLVNVRSHRLLTGAQQEKDEELKRREEEKRRERRAFRWRDYLGKRVLIGWGWYPEEFRVLEIAQAGPLIKILSLSGQHEGRNWWCYAEDLNFIQSLPEDK